MSTISAITSVWVYNDSTYIDVTLSCGHGALYIFNGTVGHVSIGDAAECVHTEDAEDDN